MKMATIFVLYEDSFNPRQNLWRPLLPHYNPSGPVRISSRPFRFGLSLYTTDNPLSINSQSPRFFLAYTAAKTSLKLEVGHWRQEATICLF